MQCTQVSCIHCIVTHCFWAQVWAHLMWLKGMIGYFLFALANTDSPLGIATQFRILYSQQTYSWSADCILLRASLILISRFFLNLQQVFFEVDPESFGAFATSGKIHITTKSIIDYIVVVVVLQSP
jgi:hypothetical protein